ncbi:transposase [Kocuria sp. M1R5S2]|uniref:transposase n=1 Tax=Kocuria rhizosphaerae TaxID=3376285 RepID=UPI0037BAA72E
MAVEARRGQSSRPGVLARVAQQSGLNPETLRNWVRQAENPMSHRYGYPGRVL